MKKGVAKGRTLPSTASPPFVTSFPSITAPLPMISSDPIGTDEEEGGREERGEEEGGGEREGGEGATSSTLGEGGGSLVNLTRTDFSRIIPMAST